MPGKFKIEDILAELDGEVEEGRFPILGVDEVREEYSVGIRLHAFASEDSWLLAFDRLLYFRPLYSYSRVADGISAKESLLGNVEPIEVLLRNGSWDYKVWFDDGCAIDPLNFTIRLHGSSERTFSFTNEDYLKIGVDLESRDPELESSKGVNLAVHILRMIDREVRDELYADPAGILNILNPADKKLEHLLTLKEYFHPPYHNPEPSQTETFRMIAEVLLSRDPARYHPSEEPNTRFSDWPFSGFDCG